MTEDKIVHVGVNNDGWINLALKYLPDDVLEWIEKNLIIVSNPERAGCRVPRSVCDEKEIIIISELLYPENGDYYAGDKEQNYSPAVRYLIFIVLHEIAHAIHDDLSPTYAHLEEPEVKKQEDKADAQALEWFNKVAIEKQEKQLSHEEINSAKSELNKRANKYYNITEP